MFSPQFFKESISNVGVLTAYFDCDLIAHIFPQFRTWLDERALSRRLSFENGDF